MSSYFLFPYAYGSFGKKKKSKPRKPKKDNWFERLTVDELKQLCKAVKLKVSGTKKNLVDQLMEHKQTSMFGMEGVRVGFRKIMNGEFGQAGTTVDDIKEMCRTRLLSVTGKKVDLVLRILYHDNNTTPEGTALKRVATEIDDETGKVVAKKRKPSDKQPCPTKIYAKIEKKINTVHQKKFQSHYGSKCHAPEVYWCMASTLREQCIDRGYVTSDPKLALSIAEAVFTSLSDNFHIMERPGYVDGGFGEACHYLHDIITAVKPLASDEEINNIVEWIDRCNAVVSPYCIGESNKPEYKLQKIKNILIANPEEDKAEKESDEDVDDNRENVKDSMKTDSTVTQKENKYASAVNATTGPPRLLQI